MFDIYNDAYILEFGAKVGMLPEWIEKERKIGQVQRDNFRKAVLGGARMAFGTDGGVYPHGDNAKQFIYMVRSVWRCGSPPAVSNRNPPPN